MLIDTLLAWQSVTVRNLTYSRNAWHGTWGLLVGILAVAFFANAVAYARILELKVRLPHRQLAIVLAPALLVLSLIKNIDDDNSGWASYVGILLAAVITYGAWLLWNEPPPPGAQPTTPPPAPQEREPSVKQ